MKVYEVREGLGRVKMKLERLAIVVRTVRPVRPTVRSRLGEKRVVRPNLGFRCLASMGKCVRMNLGPYNYGDLEPKELVE